MEYWSRKEAGMNAKRTPAIALWLLRTFGCSADTELVIGDLVERHEAGESRFWFWRQAITALVRGFLDDALSHKTVMLGTLLLAWTALVTFRWMIVVPNIIYAWTLDPSTLEKVTENGQVVGFVAPMPWYMSYPVAFLVYSILALAITGRIAARVGGAHRTAAVLTYACSYVIVRMMAIGYFFPINGVSEVPWYPLAMVTLDVAVILVGGLLIRRSEVKPDVKRFVPE
jgi:hypothetical protein